MININLESFIYKKYYKNQNDYLITKKAIIIVVTNGELLVTIDGVEYIIKKNVCIIVKKDSEIRILSKSETNLYFIKIDGIGCNTYLEELNVFSKARILNGEFMDEVISDVIKLGSVTEQMLSSKMKRHGILYQILSNLLLSTNQNKIIEKNARELAYCEKIMSIINSKTNVNVKVSDIAKSVGLNRSYMNQIFKKRYKESIKSYILIKKINISKQLLKKTDLQIKEICQSIGFKDQLHFSKIFKTYESITPTEYRKLNTIYDKK